MLKIGLYADAHFSLSSSIVLGTAGSLSGRLDILVKSFQWMAEFFGSQKIDLLVNLGDLTDKPHLRAEEITALESSLSFLKDFSQYHLLGNHEALTDSGDISSVNFLKSYQNSTLIISPAVVNNILFLPYGKYSEQDLSSFDADILFSHIDIKESYVDGTFILRDGISPDYLSKSFQMSINGHIHTGSWVRKNVLNLGSVSNLNFSSLGSKWKSSVGIFDTDTMSVELFENPHALQFVKLDVSNLGDLKSFLSGIRNPEYYVFQIKSSYDLRDDIRTILNQHRIGFSRIISKVRSGSISSATAAKIDKVNTVEDGFALLSQYAAKKSSNKKFNLSEIKSVVAEIQEQ